MPVTEIYFHFYSTAAAGPTAATTATTATNSKQTGKQATPKLLSRNGNGRRASERSAQCERERESETGGGGVGACSQAVAQWDDLFEY